VKQEISYGQVLQTTTTYSTDKKTTKIYLQQLGKYYFDALGFDIN